MTSESPERQLFNKYKEIMIKHLGSKALDDFTINRVGRKLFPAWGGVFPSDRVKLLPFHYVVINVDPHDKKGSHWLACYSTNKRAYLWDSYGRTILKLVPGLVKSIRDVDGPLFPEWSKSVILQKHAARKPLLGSSRDLGITRAKNI